MLDHIPETPSIKHCKTYVEKWHNTQTYEETDNALHLLFIELFPNNDSMSGVLLKTSALNDFYTTNLCCRGAHMQVKDRRQAPCGRLKAHRRNRAC